MNDVYFEDNCCKVPKILEKAREQKYKFHLLVL